MPLLPNAISLPAPLQRRLEGAARNFIHPARGSEIDFSAPAGELALAAPDSLSWQVFKNPLSLFIGGVTAVVLE
ncbi:MAG: oxygenase MpaB family protein, partial [Noviherbaspirillum sp.]